MIKCFYILIHDHSSADDQNDTKLHISLTFKFCSCSVFHTQESRHFESGAGTSGRPLDGDTVRMNGPHPIIDQVHRAYRGICRGITIVIKTPQIE